MLPYDRTGRNSLGKVRFGNAERLKVRPDSRLIDAGGIFGKLVENHIAPGIVKYRRREARVQTVVRMKR